MERISGVVCDSEGTLRKTDDGGAMIGDGLCALLTNLPVAFSVRWITILPQKTLVGWCSSQCWKLLGAAAMDTLRSLINYPVAGPALLTRAGDGLNTWT